MNRPIDAPVLKNKLSGFLRTPVDLKPYSRLGLASFAIALLTGLIVILDISLALRVPKSPQAVQNLRTFDLWLTWLMLALSASGIIVGVASVIQNQKKRLFGAVGLLFNILFLLAIVGLYLSNLIAFWQAASP